MKKTKELLKGMKVGVIGAGNMGRALLLGMMRSGLVSRGALMASDTDAAKRKALANEVGIATTDNNATLVDFSTIIILAVKPQVLDPVVCEIAPHVKPSQLVVSIAAGVPLKRLQKILPRNPLVRAMPNTPGLVGKGITALCGGKRAKAQHLEVAGAILGALGDVVHVPEGWMDAVTATSGSGPAYVFYFIEALVEGAIALGVKPDVAKKLVVETFAGAIELLKHTGESPKTLRQRVTSPGGTTEAAIRFLEDRQIRKILQGAQCAAAKRSKELAKT